MFGTEKTLRGILLSVVIKCIYIPLRFGFEGIIEPSTSNKFITVIDQLVVFRILLIFPAAFSSRIGL